MRYAGQPPTVGMQSCIMGRQYKEESEVCNHLLGNAVGGPCDQIGVAKAFRVWQNAEGCACIPVQAGAVGHGQC